MLPQLYQRALGFEAVQNILLFFNNIGNGLSIAPTPKSFGQKVAEISIFEILEKIEKNEIFSIFHTKI